MNKKAQSDISHEFIIWIPRIIVLVLAAGFVIFLVNIPITKNFEIDKLQQDILRQRFVYNENCLAYKDENNVYPGIIDKLKFNQLNLDNCFKANDRVGVNLNLITNDVKTINLNKNVAEKLNFCFDTKHFACTNYTYYILFKDDKSLERGLLNIAMVKLK
ncbi:MAG: hypothetical protein AABW45_03620 [Nanoarchaeota archaeon]